MGGANRALPLEWTEGLRWDDVAAPLRAEVRDVLRELLRRAARGAGEAERGDDE
jgi:hypothetical protein